MKLLSKAFDFKQWELLLIFIGLYLLIAFVTNKYITTDNYFYSALGNNLSADRINKTIEIKNKYAWLGYAILPIKVFLKLYLIALALFTAGFFFNIELSFKNALKIVLLAELVNALQLVTKTIYLLVYPPSTLDSVEKLSPLSIFSLISIDKFPAYAFYPLQFFNLFEVAYWLVLIGGVAYFLQANFKKSLAFVASSYGMGLMMWVLIVVFLQVQFS